jgi:RNA polymerase-binding transcription factor DksA
VDEGTYGYSDVSGEFIGEERLDAIPYATLTRDEQERTVQG